METTKMEAAYKLSALKILLQCVSSISILIAILMLVAGLAGYGHYHSWSYFFQPGHQRLMTPSLMVAVLGAGLVVLTLCGLLAASLKSYCLVYTYAVVLSALWLVQLVGVVLAFSVDLDSLSAYISIPVAKYGSHEELKTEINLLQKTLKCCGGTSYKDYIGVNYTETHDLLWLNNQVLIPSTCCAHIISPVDCAAVYSGCYALFTNMVDRNLNSIGVLGVSVLFVQLIALGLALSLFHSIRKGKLQRAQLEWVVKEQMLYMQQDLQYNIL